MLYSPPLVEQVHVKSTNLYYIKQTSYLGMLHSPQSLKQVHVKNVPDCIE